VFGLNALYSLSPFTVTHNTNIHVSPTADAIRHTHTRHNGCCTSNNGQGWPKLALRVVFTTPDDDGVAIGIFAPVRAQLSPGTVLVVDTDYPAADIVTVLLSRDNGGVKTTAAVRTLRGAAATTGTAASAGAGSDATNTGATAGAPTDTSTSRATPLKIRIPTWAVNATAWFNGVKLPQASVRNGTMLVRSCAGGLPLCNFTLDLAPRVRMESSFSSTVAVYRGPLLFCADLGRNFMDYSPGCEQPPYYQDGCTDLGPEPRPAAAGWWGVSATRLFNLALVKPAESLVPTHRRSSLDCTVGALGSGNRTDWPACALTTPAACIRQCDSPFAGLQSAVSPPPTVLQGVAREVKGWTMASGSDIEADVPPASPACSVVGACSDTDIKLTLVPFASTELRVASFPVA
jgi:hypothetical protein